MNRQEKSLVIDTLKNDFEKSQASFLVNYKGLTVAQLQALRKALSSTGSSFKVAKARLVKIAAQDIENAEPLTPFLKEQVGVVFAYKDVSAAAKALHDFAKQNEQCKLVAGCFEAKPLNEEAINRIALLPSREVLLAQVCGTLKAPITGLVVALNQNILRLLWALKQVGEKKQA
ncbi:MAG: 50S ribosomal protein L10 [Candidatus Dependentiae bacterium]